MTKKITLKTIAKELDLSISTVSKALHNSSEISEETIRKVQAYAKLYRYRPNNIALSLKNQSTKTIGVIIPELVHEFFSKVIQGIEEIAYTNDYKVIISTSNESLSSEIHNIELLNSGAIDGFIIGISKESLQKNEFSHIQNCLDYHIPVVLFDRAVESLNTDKVIIDDFESGYNATNYLIESGKQTIAIVTTPDYITVGRKRFEGYTKAMDEHSLKVNHHQIIPFDGGKNFSKSLEELEGILIEHLKQHTDIDGIVTLNEANAVSVLRAARALKINVPEDLAVITFSDGLISKSTYPSLTTICQQGIEMGRQAALTLLNRIENTEGEYEFKTIEIPTKIIKRESTTNLVEAT